MTLQILLVHDDPVRAADLRAGLEQARWGVAAMRPNLADLARHAHDCAADAIVCTLAHPSSAAISAVQALNGTAPRPVIMFVDRSDQALTTAAMQAGVTALVVQGLSPARVQSVVEVALARFKAEQSLRAELNQARMALSERKLIDRAKRVLMQARHLSEDEAYRAMQKLAMDQGRRMADVASSVLAVADVLRNAP